MTRRLGWCAALLLAGAALAQQPSLRPTVTPVYPDFPAQVLEPTTHATALVAVQNHGGDAMNPVIRMTLPEGGVFTGVVHKYGEGALCTTTPDEIVCEMSRLRAGELTSLEVSFITPAREDGSTFALVVTAKGTVPNVPEELETARREIRLRRILVVSSSSDDGAGSLRQTILESRTLCAGTHCRIIFRPPPATAIQPRTPLPELRGEVKIDGGAERVILDGSLAGAGDGLRYETGCELRVLNMVIRNFSGHAIEAHQLPSERRRPECGSDAFGTPVHVARNELYGNVRGVVTRGVSATIADNVIRDQQRAGIFVDGGFYTEIARNVIVANGASGVFINTHDASISSFPPGADVYQNVIRANGEWGVCRTNNGGVVGVWENEIADNGLYGYDPGLDLATPNRPTQHDPGLPNKPLLFSATYDPAAGRTIVRGRADTSGFGGSPRVDLYASHRLGARGAFPQAERWLASTHQLPTFEVSVPGDLRGQWITATTTRVVGLIFLSDPAADVRGTTGRNTSELSDAIQVQ